MLSKLVYSLSRNVGRRHFQYSAVLNGLIKTNNDEADFLTKVMNSDNVVLVNFQVPSNKPSQELSSMMRDLLAPCKYVDLAVVDLEKNKHLAETFEVTSTPTVLAVQNGLVIDKLDGEIDNKMIRDMVKKYNK